MKVKIIIADDHQLFIDGIKSILTNEIGISIVGEANNGLQVIQLLESGICADVILTDIRMPVMNGIATTRLLAKQFPKIPVLALSMYDQPSDIQEMLDAGALGYIVKNSGKQELIKAIHALHQGRKYLSKDLEQYQLEGGRTGSKQYPLSRREKQIVALIAKGRTSHQIAEELHISKLTVDSHRKNIYKKLGLKTVAGLIKFALEERR